LAARRIDGQIADGHSDRDGAIAVYRAALVGSDARDHLRKRCLALTGVDPETDAEGSA
jgi:hypothetical protein